jgi:hypothetical protein
VKKIKELFKEKEAELQEMRERNAKRRKRKNEMDRSYRSGEEIKTNNFLAKWRRLLAGVEQNGEKRSRTD